MSSLHDPSTSSHPHTRVYTQKHTPLSSRKSSIMLVYNTPSRTPGLNNFDSVILLKIGTNPPSSNTLEFPCNLFCLFLNRDHHHTTTCSRNSRPILLYIVYYLLVRSQPLSLVWFRNRKIVVVVVLSYWTPLYGTHSMDNSLTSLTTHLNPHPPPSIACSPYLAFESVVNQCFFLQNNHSSHIVNRNNKIIVHV